jgi:hypothetical protein
LPNVNWITYGCENPGHSSAYRAAQADFNVRGWQGRWRYTAPDGLVLFGGSSCPAASIGDLSLNPRRLVICVRRYLLAEYTSYAPRCGGFGFSCGFGFESIWKSMTPVRF